MKKILSNIGHIIDTAPAAVAAKARALLYTCSNPSTSSQSAIIAGYIGLVCDYIEAMDAGAEYDPLEFVADATEDWIKFDARLIAPPRPRLKRDPEFRNPDFFPLLAEASTDDDFDAFDDDFDQDFGFGGDE